MPGRYLRAMLERFVPATPFASTFMARSGQILGTPANCKRVLEAEGAILVFPEGVRGLNKTWTKRYKLQEFGLDAANPLKLDVSVFKKKGPHLSGNAKTVLERRYLKKDRIACFG